MSLRGVYADGLPFGPPHSGRERQTFRAPAYKRVDIGMSYRLLDNTEYIYRTGLYGYIKNIWVGVDAFNLLDINNVNSYYWVSDIYNIILPFPTISRADRLTCVCLSSCNGVFPFRRKYPHPTTTKAYKLRVAPYDGALLLVYKSARFNFTRQPLFSFLWSFLQP